MTRSMKRAVVAVAGISVWLLPNLAWAHLVSTRFGELYSGFLHPLTALQHVVPWLALGLLGGLQQTTTARWALLIFPLTVGIGATLALWLPALDFVLTLNLLSFVILGLLVALAPRLGALSFGILVAVLGLSHGYANAALELSGGDQLLYISGVVLAAYMLIALATGAAYTVAQGLNWGGIALRAAGSWVAAIGIMTGSFSLIQ